MGSAAVSRGYTLPHRNPTVFCADGRVFFYMTSCRNNRWSDPPVSYGNSSGIGWYRRHLAGATAAQLHASAAGTLELALGTVSGSDETYLNGVKIGNTGDITKAGGEILEYSSLFLLLLLLLFPL